MITQLVTRTYNVYSGAIERTLTFNMSGSEYIVKNIDGLGPVKSEVTTMGVPTEAGSRFMTARDVARNIVLTIGFQPNYGLGSSYEGLRRALYAALVPSTKVQLIFTDSVLGVMTIDGYVETHEPDIFSQDPQVQISVICPTPYFTGTPGYQSFPIASGPSFSLNYPGDVPVGFIFDADFIGNTSQLYVGNQPVVYFGFVNFNFSFLNGDHVYFNTIPGDRDATYERSAATNSLLGYQTGSLTKTKLQPGMNYFTVTGSSFITNIVIQYNRLYGSL